MNVQQGTKAYVQHLDFNTRKLVYRRVVVLNPNNGNAAWPVTVCLKSNPHNIMHVSPDMLTPHKDLP